MSANNPRAYFEAIKSSVLESLAEDYDKRVLTSEEEKSLINDPVEKVINDFLEEIYNMIKNQTLKWTDRTQEQLTDAIVTAFKNANSETQEDMPIQIPTKETILETFMTIRKGAMLSIPEDKSIFQGMPSVQRKNAERTTPVKRKSRARRAKFPLRGGDQPWTRYRQQMLQAQKGTTTDLYKRLQEAKTPNPGQLINGPEDEPKPTRERP